MKSIMYEFPKIIIIQKWKAVFRVNIISSYVWLWTYYVINSNKILNFSSHYIE